MVLLTRLFCFGKRLAVVVVDGRGQSDGIWILKRTGSSALATIIYVFQDTITIKLVYENDS